MTLPELILVEISIKRFGRKTNFICAGSSGYRLNMISESMFPFYGISKKSKTYPLYAITSRSSVNLKKRRPSGRI